MYAIKFIRRQIGHAPKTKWADCLLLLLTIWWASTPDKAYHRNYGLLEGRNRLPDSSVILEKEVERALKQQKIAQGTQKWPAIL